MKVTLYIDSALGIASTLAVHNFYDDEVSVPQAIQKFDALESNLQSTRIQCDRSMLQTCCPSLKSMYYIETQQIWAQNWNSNYLFSQKNKYIYVYIIHVINIVYSIFPLYASYIFIRKVFHIINKHCVFRDDDDDDDGDDVVKIS